MRMLREGLRRAAERILDQETPLRSRLFQLLSTIALAEFVFVSVYTMVSGGSAGHVALMLVGTALFATTVALTFRTGRMRLGSTISGLLYFLIYPLTFFSSGGMYGGAPVVFAFALIYVFLVTQRWERVASLTVCIAGTFVCYAISYLYPHVLVRHMVLIEHVESFLSIALVTLLVCTLFAFVTQVYNEENQTVQRQKRDIEELNQAQKRFFSSMSHEIRTPVNAIVGFNEMTMKEDISDEVRENAQNIDVASKILLQTINEILDMSKLETGTMEILPADYRTVAVLEDVVNMVWLRAQDKGLEFVVRADPTLPRELRGDEVRIRQVLLNVTTNAVKYTKAGSVTIAMSGKTDDAGGFWAIFDVIDTGIGIREEDLPHLFGAFNRVDEQQTHNIEGTGLGLSIVRQLLDLMGGHVSVTSTYGEGSTFHIEIPQEVVDAAPIGEVEFAKQRRVAPDVQQDPLVVSELRILAVDDTPMNLKVVQKLLRETVALIETATNGEEALEKTRATHYDVILMDHQMPGMTGIECLHRIREQTDGRCTRSKVVCLTANGGPDMEQAYLQEGFDGYLVKPVRGATLEAELARVVGQ